MDGTITQYYWYPEYYTDDVVQYFTADGLE